MLTPGPMGAEVVLLCVGDLDEADRVKTARRYSFEEAWCGAIWLPVA